MINRNASRIIGIIGGVMLAFGFVTARSAVAQEHATAHAPAPAHSTEAAHSAPAGEEEARPVLPTDPSAWAGTMLIIIVAMFLMAAVIGPMVRMEIPAELHDDAHGHGHDDHGHAADPHAHGHH
ncbi:MAG: hypothetical protein H7Z14_22185 [Anaerolineae bacterium]|nr:hypothetical protein [Phycisphaerae bacterium]